MEGLRTQDLLQGHQIRLVYPRCAGEKASHKAPAQLVMSSLPRVPGAWMGLRWESETPCVKDSRKSNIYTRPIIMCHA